MRRALLLVALALACRKQATEPARPDAGAVAPPPAVSPCADAPVPEDTSQAVRRASILLRCDDEPGALAIRRELLRREPGSTARAHALAALAHLVERPAETDAAVAELPLTPPARAVYSLTRDVLAYLDRPDPARGAALARDVAAALALAVDDPHVLSLALRFTAVHDADPGERAAPICRERADPQLERPHDGAAVLAAACARIAFLSGEPADGRRRYARALELASPDDIDDPALAWAAAELAAGNFPEAARLYARAAEHPSARLRYAAALGLGVARVRMHDRAGAEAAYRAAAALRGVSGRPVPADRLPPELQFNLGSVLADAPDPAARAEARALLTAYAAHPGADDRRRLRARQLLRELGG